jgi:hypothetical protein
MSKNLLLGIAATLLLASGINAGDPNPALQNDDIKFKVLEWVNTKKCLHGQDEANYYKMACAEGLAYSQQLAEDNAAKGSLSHSDSYKFKGCGSSNGWGENIFMSSGSGDANTHISALNYFYNEIDCWDFSTSKQKTTAACTGKQVLHFSALIWKDATQISLGIAQSSKSGVYVTHNMAPSVSGAMPPNFSGYYAKNVTPLSSERDEAYCQPIVAAWLKKYKVEYGAEEGTADDDTTPTPPDDKTPPDDNTTPDDTTTPDDNTTPDDTTTPDDSDVTPDVTPDEQDPTDEPSSAFGASIIAGATAAALALFL